MTREERLKAFTMRLDGMDWREIGQKLGYSHTNVYNDLHSIIMRPPKQIPCIYPAIRSVIESKYGSSVHAFATDCGLSYSAMYQSLTGRNVLSDARRALICKAAGLSETEAFQTEVD